MSEGTDLPITRDERIANDRLVGIIANKMSKLMVWYGLKKRKYIFCKGVYNYVTVIFRNSLLFSSYSKGRKRETRVSDSTCVLSHTHVSNRSKSSIVEIK